MPERHGQGRQKEATDLVTRGDVTRARSQKRKGTSSTGLPDFQVLHHSLDHWMSFGCISACTVDKTARHIHSCVDSQEVNVFGKILLSYSTCWTQSF